MSPTPPDAKTRLLDSAINVFRAKGYNATTVDDICAAAGVTKGSFFHHFSSKEQLAVATTLRWTEVTDQLFSDAPYQALTDPRDRVLGYIVFRAHLVRGELPEYSCLLGTLVQEAYDTHPAIAQACGEGIRHHADSVAQDLAAAKQLYAPAADWQPLDLALYTQATLQGAFVVAKAHGGAPVALRCVEHLYRYVAMLLGAPGVERMGPIDQERTR